jgi:hypothetical protein
MQRIQSAELLGHHQRRVVGKHHSAGAETQPRGAGGEVGDQHRRRGTGDAVHVVVLGDPETGVAQFLRAARQIEGVAQGTGGIAVGADGRQIQNGNGNGSEPAQVPHPGPAVQAWLLQSKS